MATTQECAIEEVRHNFKLAQVEPSIQLEIKGVRSELTETIDIVLYKNWLVVEPFI